MLSAAAFAEATAFSSSSSSSSSSTTTSSSSTTTTSSFATSPSPSSPRVLSPDPTILAPRRRHRIEYVHGLAESSPFESGSFDVVALTFILHECPEDAIRAIYAEAARLVRPGGVVAMTDMNPRSPVIQGLPPVLATLMKSTEPWSDSYYCTNIEQVASDVGLERVEYHVTDPRHRTIIGVKPR